MHLDKHRCKLTLQDLMNCVIFSAEIDTAFNISVDRTSKFLIILLLKRFVCFTEKLNQFSAKLGRVFLILSYDSIKENDAYWSCPASPNTAKTNYR